MKDLQGSGGEQWSYFKSLNPQTQVLLLDGMKNMSGEYIYYSFSNFANAFMINRVQINYECH